jgi:hypothetical protein
VHRNTAQRETHALVNPICGVPTWMMASVVIAIIVDLSLIGRVISSRVLHPEIRRRHNDHKRRFLLFCAFSSFRSGNVVRVFATEEQRRPPAHLANSAWRH